MICTQWFLALMASSDMVVNVSPKNVNALAKLIKVSRFDEFVQLIGTHNNY